MKIAYHDDVVDFKTILNDLTYYDLNQFLDEKKILSTNSSQRATLLLQLNQGETIIEFTNGDENAKPDNDKEDDKKDGNNLTLILAITIPVAVILIVIIIVLVCRCKRKKSDIEVSGETKDEELMPQGE